VLCSEGVSVCSGDQETRARHREKRSGDGEKA
jgi:hypothetical protein